jgi:tetratricopeptide (TPR) repeat protein
MMTDPDWLTQLIHGDREFSRQRYSQAQAHYEEAVKIAPNERVPHERLGNFYYFSGRMDASLKHLFQAFELGSTDPLVFFNLGRIYFLGHELLDRGRYFLDRALLLAPNSEALIGTYLGALFYLKGRADDAIELLLRLRLATPLREPLEFFLGCAYHDIGNDPHAERHFKHALALEPKNVETLLCLGNSQFRQKKYEDALNSYRKACEINPNYSPAWHNAGIAFQFLGRHPESSDFLKEAFSLKNKKEHSKRGTTEEPGLEKQTWQHVERLLLEGTIFRGQNPITLS